MPFTRHPDAASTRRTKGTSSAWGIPRFFSSNMAATMGTLNEVFPGVEMSIDNVATGLIRMRKHWFSVKVQKSFSPDGKILKILSVVSYLGFPSPSEEIILWSTWCSHWEASLESGLTFCLKSEEIMTNLQRTCLSCMHRFPKSPIQVHQTEPAFALMLW